MQLVNNLIKLLSKLAFKIFKNRLSLEGLMKL